LAKVAPFNDQSRASPSTKPARNVLSVILSASFAELGHCHPCRRALTDVGLRVSAEGAEMADDCPGSKLAARAVVRIEAAQARLEAARRRVLQAQKSMQLLEEKFQAIRERLERMRNFRR
jgi:hypothetical protein